MKGGDQQVKWRIATRQQVSIIRQSLAPLKPLEDWRKTMGMRWLSFFTSLCEFDWSGVDRNGIDAHACSTDHKLWSHGRSRGLLSMSSGGADRSCSFKKLHTLITGCADTAVHRTSHYDSIQT